MRILALTDRYWPEIAAPSFRLADHARVWLEDGHEVTVVTCAPNFPHGKVFSGYRNRLFQEERHDGVRILRLWSYMAENSGTIKRTLDHLSFVASAVANARRFPKCDVILATSPPLFTALGGYLLSRICRRPWLFEVRDLWPATIKAVGAANGRILHWLEKLEMFLYRKADMIAPLTHAFQRDLVARGVDEQKIRVVTNGVELAQFDAVTQEAGRLARRRLGINNDVFLAGYIGTTGMCQGLSTLVDAAELCRHDPSLQFLIMGEGAERKMLEQRAREKALNNLHFADFVPHGQIADYYRALDVGLIHLRPDPLFHTVIPSKIFEFMACRTPLLMAAEGECAGIVRQAECGVCVPPGDPAAIAEAVQKLKANRQALANMGENGRRAVELGFSRRVLARDLMAVMEQAVERYHGGKRREDASSNGGVTATDRRRRGQRVHRSETGATSGRRAA